MESGCSLGLDRDRLTELKEDLKRWSVTGVEDEDIGCESALRILG